MLGSHPHLMVLSPGQLPLRAHSVPGLLPWLAAGPCQPAASATRAPWPRGKRPGAACASRLALLEDTDTPEPYPMDQTQKKGV